MYSITEWFWMLKKHIKRKWYTVSMVWTWYAHWQLISRTTPSFYSLFFFTVMLLSEALTSSSSSLWEGPVHLPLSVQRNHQADLHKVQLEPLQDWKQWHFFLLAVKKITNSSFFFFVLWFKSYRGESHISYSIRN